MKEGEKKGEKKESLLGVDLTPFHFHGSLFVPLLDQVFNFSKTAFLGVFHPICLGPGNSPPGGAIDF